MIRLGMIGGGINSAVGAAHVAALRMTGKFELVVGCFSHDWVQGRDTAEKYASTAAHNIEELMSVRPDRAVVLSPTPLHRQHIENIAGFSLKHTAILCEKALGISSSETAWMLKYPTPLSVVYNYAFYPAVQKLRELLNSGELGAVTHVHVEMPQSGYLTAKPQAWRLSDSGIYLDLGTHLHHLIWFLTGASPEAVQSVERRLGSLVSVVDYASALVRYHNFDAHMWFGKVSAGYTNGLRIRVFCADGSAEWYQREPDVLRLASAETNYVSASMEVPNPRFKLGHPTGYIEALANLYEAWAADPSHPDLSPIVAHEGLLLMEAMREAALSGKEVTL